MFLFTHQRSQKAPNTQRLHSAEALTMPRVQMIVLNANMRCPECRDKVSKVLSKMDNLQHYGVDVSQEKVTVRGRVNPKKRIQRIRAMANHEKTRKAIEFERQMRGKRHNSLTKKYCRSKWTLKSRNISVRLACRFRCALVLAASAFGRIISSLWTLKSPDSTVQRACRFRCAFASASSARVGSIDRIIPSLRSSVMWKIRAIFPVGV